MPNLGSLWWTMGIKDLTDADLKKINAKLKSVGSEIQLTPKILKDLAQSAVPRGVKIELDPTIKNEALARAVEGKVLNISVKPLVSNLRSALRQATKDNPPEMEVGVQSVKLRKIIEDVLNKQGFMINISTINDNYSKVVQQKLNGTRYTVKIHADAKEITRSVQASLMQVQSRYFGLKVSQNILYRSIDEALGQRRFNINIAVQHDQARKAVQDALLRAQVMGKDQALAYQRLQTGELKAAQAELVRLKAAHMGAAEAARAHATASVSLGGAMGSNIKIAGELGSAMTSIYSVHAAKEFLSQVIEIGGELEHQKIAMDTIFGDKGKTSELFGQVKGLARQSPFGVMELTKSVKALSAYGVQYNEIYDTAKRLADISAATSVDINRLILAFGKTKSRGFLDGLEAKQFAYANIPIYEMVRRKLEELEGQAVTTAQVMERMKKREISFDIVKDVLWDMTDEGGKFYNMQEALAGSVKTSWKLVRDNIELMFGEIAESDVGDALKDIAEILQLLTRNWRTMGAVIASAAVVLGVYKVATLASNIAIDKGTAAVYSNIMAEKARTAQRLRTFSVIGKLDEAEKRLVKNAKTLQLGEFQQLLTEKKLNSAQILRLGLSGKLSKKQLMYAASVGEISKEEAKAIIRGRLWGMNLGQLGNALKLVGVQLRTLGAAFISFLPTASVMALVGSLMYAWQKNSEQMEKAKEIGDNLFTKATEGADNLRQTLKEIKPSTGLSEHELSQGIEQMEQAIKDYSPKPLQDINDTLVAQDGHVMTLSERYDALKKRIEEVANAYELIGDVKNGDGGTIISDAIKSTGGWFNDDVITNAKDYSDALKKRSDAIRKYSIEYPRSIKKAVEKAIEADNEFAKATEGMRTTAAKWNELASNPAKYRIAYNTPEVGMILANAGLGELNKDIEKQKSTFEADVQKSIRDITAGIRITWDKEIKDLDDSEKDALVIMLKNMLNQAEGISEEARVQWSKALETAFGVSVLEEDDFKRVWAEQLNKAFGKAPEYVKEALLKARYFGAESLGDVLSSMPRYTEQAFDATMKIFPEKESEIKEWLSGHSLTWMVDFAFANAPESQKASDVVTSLVRKTGLQGLTPEIDSLLVRWGKSNDPQQMRQMAAEEWKAAKERLASAKLWGESSEIYQNALSDFQAKNAALAYLKWEDLKLEMGGGADKDLLADSLKQRFKDIKDAWSEFQKWSKTEGREAAATRIGEGGLFSTLSADQIPKTIEDYRVLVKGLEDELRKSGIKGTARESLLNDLLKQLLDIDKTVVDEQLKLALDKVSKEAERQLADWNLFDKIRKATGNQDLAMSIAFGMNADAETDYPTLVKKQFNDFAKAAKSALTFDTVTPEALAAAPIEVQKEWENATKKLQQYAREQKDAIADILNKYQSLQDKLAKIDADRDRETKMVQESDMSAPDKAKYIQRINVEADYQKFTQSADYLKFFSGIYSLTMDKAQEIGDKIRQNLDLRLQAGAISAEDYYKEIERINQQLTKLRNVKSDTLTFLTGGVKGLNQKKLEIADSNILAQMTKVQEAEEALEKAKASGDIKQVAAAELTLKLAKTELDTRLKIRDAIVKDMEAWQKVLDVVNIVGNIAGGISDAFNSIRDMADALGADTESGAWDDIAAAMDTLTAVTGGVQKVVQSAMSGDIGGILSGAVSTITSPFTIWSQLHDKKLQKMIDRSKEAAQIMQNQYDILEKRMANFLGNAADMKVEGYSGKGGAYGKQRQLMQSQLAELEKQRQAEMDKKKSDNSVVEDYNKQIEEMKISIRDFAIEAAKDLYSIDLSGWAEQLGDSLVDAFAAGEDAAEAFDKTVGDIMRDVTSKMISQDILAPMFGDLRNFLFGENGKGGAFGADFKLDASEMAAMKTYLDKIKDEGIPAAEELFNAINEATGGILNETNTAKSGLSAGIQALTENTGDLLASYLNQIRADVAMQTGSYWSRLLDDSLPQMNVIAQSQLDTQRQIAENTLRTAIAAEAIQKSNDAIGGLLNRVSQGAAKFHV